MAKPPEFPVHYRDFVMDLARADQIPQLTAIVARVFEEYGWEFSASLELPDFEDFRAYYGDNRQEAGKPRVFAIQSATGRICGVIALKFNEEGACLSRVYIDNDLRGRGIGTWMIQQVLDLAKSEGITSIHLWTDTQFTGAHRLYERMGFSMTRVIRSLHDINHCFEWKMTKDL
jgi:putative acetyltransferase